MSRQAFLIVFLTAALSFPTKIFARDENVSAFVTNDFANVRKGPGTNWTLLTVIPPASPVNVDYCSAKWSVGWCEVTYEGQTGYVHSSLLRSVEPPTSSKDERKSASSGPPFLVQAQKNYRQAQHALEVEKRKLDRLHQEEARLSQIAMTKTGSWIEPNTLWHQKLAEEQKLAYLQELAAQARAELDNAEDKARSISSARWSRAHSPRRSLLWQWL